MERRMLSCKHLLVLLLLGVSGCSTIEPGQQAGRPTYYLGLIKYQSVSDKHTEQSSVHSYGVRVEHGVTLGYVSEQKVIVPKGCQLIVFVRTQEQLQQVKDLINTLKGASICEVQEQG